MSGYMVATVNHGAKEFFMVNTKDRDQACAQVLRYTVGKVADVLTPLSDETLAHFNVQPNEPWMCFMANPNGHAIVGDGTGLLATAFSDGDGDGVLQDVGRGEFHFL